MTRREIWGQDIEGKIQSAHCALGGLTLADPAELKPHTQGLLEIRDKLEIALGKALQKEAA